MLVWRTSLAGYPTKAVAIVESEKSALVASHFMPDFVWLATGGIHGCFKADTVGVLKNHAVILCPDLGAKMVWQEKVQLLSSVCSKVVFSENWSSALQTNKGKKD